MQRGSDEKRSLGKLSPVMVPTVPCSAAPGIVVCEPRHARRLTAPRGPVATPGGEIAVLEGGRDGCFSLAVLVGLSRVACCACVGLSWPLVHRRLDRRLFRKWSI